MKSILLFSAFSLVFVIHTQAQWIKITAIPSKDIVALALNGDTLLAASAKNKIYKSTDGGSTWDSLQYGANTVNTVTMKIIDHSIFVTTNASGIFSSSDGGLTWTTSGAGLFPAAALEKNGSDLFAATLGNGIYRFDSLSGNWTSFNNALPSYSVNVFDLAATSQSILASAGSNGTFYRYNFSQNSWNEEYYYGRLKPGLQIQQLFHSGDTLFAITGNRIIRSNNDGFSWSNDYTGSHLGYSRRIFGGATYHYTVTNLIGGGTWIQHRDRSASIGSNWSINEEFFPTGYSYDILEYHGALFLAKQDGLYAKIILPASVNPIPGLPVVQIAPNPSLGEINISCPELIKKVILMNTAGQQVYTMAIGQKKFSFSPKLPEGMYALVLELADGRTIFRKIIIE